MENERQTTGQNIQHTKTTRPAVRRKRRKNKKRRVLFWVGTLALIAVLTMAIFVGIFMRYINTVMKGNVEISLAQYDPSVSSELYYQDPDTGEWVMYQTLFLDAQNRIWVDLEDIPDNLKNAAIAIEDKRFEEHHGVDWKGTLRAVLVTVTGKDVQGGSTITQQLIKNITGDKESTVKRKITEIYRALQLEKDYSKDQILEMYLNYIYMGGSSYGVQTSAQKYFSKDVEELDLAECASLIGITNNPSRYNPLISDWTREQNRERQVTVLQAMLDQGMITQEEYDQAYNEAIVFSDGYNIFGEYVGEEALPEEEEETDTEVHRANNSYFTDAVIEDVIAALMDKYSIDYSSAESMTFSGLKIYTTQNIKYQTIMENVFETTDIQNLTDSNGEPMQAAMTLIDPYTGYVLGMVGGTGIKEYDRSWNWATSARQCGSAIKPISTYAPAMDNGTISAGSVIDDYPYMELSGSPWPKNSHAGFYGMTTVWTALVQSLNTCAVRVNVMYGTAASYNFMTDKLGFTTLTYTDSQQAGNMALGGLENGVTTEEMAAAYSIFDNDGIYTSPITFTKVEDANGNVIIDNQPNTTAAIKPSTAYLMTKILQGVVSSGTGGGASFSGMSIAGKTGTTDSSRDRYFVGYTPYYCAAVWCGYKSNAKISGVSGNPCATLWKQVMSQIHEGLSNPGFGDGSGTGLTTVTLCLDSGLLATDACHNDVRGDRTQTVTVAADTAPTSSCNIHSATVAYCTEGKHIATSACPESSVVYGSLLDYDRELFEGVEAADHYYLLKVASEGDACPVHGAALPETSTDGTGGTDGATTPTTP